MATTVQETNFRDPRRRGPRGGSFLDVLSRDVTGAAPSMAFIFHMFSTLYALPRNQKGSFLILIENRSIALTNIKPINV